VAAGERSPGRARKYRDVIDAYIAPRLGPVALPDVTVEVVDTFYETLLTSGRPGHGRKVGDAVVARHQAGGLLGAGTVRNVHTIMPLACVRAARYGWVPSMTAIPAAEAERMDPDWHATCDSRPLGPARSRSSSPPAARLAR
jgi:hypothetical protein